jgi:ferritin-like metal-binding protein YciE
LYKKFYTANGLANCRRVLKRNGILFITQIIIQLTKNYFIMATKSKSKSAKSAKPAKSSSAGAAQGDSMLKEFFVDELKDIYWAEKHLVQALPKMQKAATSEELAAAIEEHLEVTQTHVQRLEDVFEMVGEKAQAKKCDAMEGLVKEGQGVIEDTEDGTATRDVALIMAAQKVEHYEIATYGGLVQLATTLGLEDVAEILQTTLDEEKETDVKLTEIAETSVNYEAANEDEEEEE